MSKYSLTIGTEEFDSISREERTELLEELSEEIDREVEYEYPPKHLSSPVEDAILTIGTVMLSNQDQLIHLWKTIIEVPKFTLQGVFIQVDNKFVFQLPEEVNINVDVDILSNFNGFFLYESEEKPEPIKQAEKQQLLNKINRIQPDGEEFEFYEEFQKEYGRE